MKVGLESWFWLNRAGQVLLHTHNNQEDHDTSPGLGVFSRHLKRTQFRVELSESEAEGGSPL